VDLHGHGPKILIAASPESIAVILGSKNLFSRWRKDLEN
jgi:hypothetical protein